MKEKNQEQKLPGTATEVARKIAKESCKRGKGKKKEEAAEQN